VPSVRQIAEVAEAGSRDLDATVLLLTTQDQVAKTVAGVANYGGSLDVILDDALERKVAVLAFMAVGVVTILAVLLIVVALVYYLVSVILELRKITNGLDVVITHVGEIVQKSAPVNDVVKDINGQLDAGVDLLEGLLVKKAGLTDAVGLVEGLYAGSAAAGFRSIPESTTIDAPRIGEVYTRGNAHARPARPRGADRRRESRRAGVERRRAREPAARQLYPDGRQTRPESLPRSPVIGTDAPEQYEQREDIGAPRKRLPDRTA
jgi:hypothetical protein